ncbi:MAG: cation-efflux pump, partial [Actinomycetota bacterium]|nr:cation-efflux pump [Actinomycetota bacterium]
MNALARPRSQTTGPPADHRGLRAADMTGSDERGPSRTALASIAAAAVLVVLKLGTGLLTGSLGLISAGIESSGDVVAAVLTFFAIRLGVRPADADHHYGHRRAENLAALGEAAILAGGGIVVVVEAVGRLAGGSEPFEPRWYVFAVIGIALAIDAARIRISLRTAASYNSAALRSNAFHFAGDMAGTLAVLAGLLLVSAGFAQGDAVAALVVAGIIFAAAGRLIYENSRVLMDTAPADARTRAEQAIASVRDDVELRRLRLRESGGRYFADAVVTVPPGQANVEGHAVADDVEAAVHDALPGSDVVVHLEPQQDGLDLRDRALAVALAEPLVREAHDISLYEHDGQVSLSLHLKMPAELPLEQAHEVAERVEAALRAEPEVDEVQTHLEPLERPLAAATDASRDAAETARIHAVVADRTGQPPRELWITRADSGRVVFLTVSVGEQMTLTEAHELASRLEEDLRRGQPHMADVVVHTEPRTPNRWIAATARRGQRERRRARLGSPPG